ncbi:MAG: hypothetical protein V4523_12480 [Pseudomonadota bacterium]
MDNNLTIQLFFFAAGITVALEAYKAQRIARACLWAIAAAFGFAGFAWPSLSASWPVITQKLAALTTNPVTWFALSVSVFFVVRPYWTRSSTSALHGSLAVTDHDITETTSQITAINVRLAGLDAKAEQIRVDTALVSRDLQQLDQQVASKDEKVMHSLYAIGARERLARLESEIEQDAADLYDRLQAGEVYDAGKWQQWENVHSHWNGQLEEWLATATWYAIAVKERTLTVDEALYRAPWSMTESQFPDAEAVRQFRKHRIILANWREVVPDVRRGVDLVAFSGQSEQDVRHGRPAG